MPIHKFPIVATVEPPPKTVEEPPPPDPIIYMETIQCLQPDQPPPLTIDVTKLVLTGPGLTMARCLEPAQFLIDGANAGPGQSLTYLLNSCRD